ncbi:Rha family transcriptional regulator [Ottowia thiooxydans]|uniref:Rha family transcriptional regulator n=1 Tax=Ottowia thiooxydans TaxID=219182 RepID=UPI00040F5538|nr:Rha family transcriptional regulator [Ottowia thiooxydans]
MNDLSEFVAPTSGTLTTDSRKVAKHFGKRHDSVLRSFDKLSCSEEFRQHNFVAAKDLDVQGKPRRTVLMTKNGFIFLAMGFTGAKASKFTVPVEIEVDEPVNSHGQIRT